MNVYDFDGTIYDGDSTVDFYFYCLCRQPRIVKHMLVQIKGFVLYKRRKIDKTQLKEYFFSFLNSLDGVDDIVVSFWENHYIKIKKWYFDIKKEDDIIISASPLFLLAPLKVRLNIKDVIATRVDGTTGKIEGKNCFGHEKIIRFEEEYKLSLIDCVYSDSVSDLPLAQQAKNAYLVKKNAIIEWDLTKKI